MQVVLALDSEVLVRMIAGSDSDTLDGYVLVHNCIADSCELVGRVAVVALVLVTVLCIQLLLFQDIVVVTFASGWHTFEAPEHGEQLLDHHFDDPIGKIWVDNCDCYVVNRFRIRCSFA